MDSTVLSLRLQDLNIHNSGPGTQEGGGPGQHGDHPEDTEEQEEHSLLSREGSISYNNISCSVNISNDKIAKTCR